MILVSAMSLLTLGFGQSDGDSTVVPAPLRSLNNSAFKEGEKLTYVVRYGFLHAGEAILELKETDKDAAGRPLIHAVGKGRSLGAFNTFYKVDDLYETYMDKQGVFPYYFKRRVNEGGYKINHDYIFKQKAKKVKTQDKKLFDVPAHTQDMLSAFYYARTLDFSDIQVGDAYTINCFFDEELFPVRLKFLGRETLKTKRGKFKCLKFVPAFQSGRIFKDEDDVTIWVTDDANRMPVLLKAKILVGSIKMELTGYEGLANPVARVK